MNSREAVILWNSICSGDAEVLLDYLQVKKFLPPHKDHYIDIEAYEIADFLRMFADGLEGE